jgi:hypothetical protein
VVLDTIDARAVEEKDIAIQGFYAAAIEMLRRNLNINRALLVLIS